MEGNLLTADEAGAGAVQHEAIVQLYFVTLFLKSGCSADVAGHVLYLIRDANIRYGMKQVIGYLAWHMFILDILFDYNVLCSDP